MNRIKGIYKRNEGRWEARFKVGVDENGRARYQSVYAKTREEVIAKRTAITGEEITETEHTGPKQLNLLILGAGTHGKDVYEIAESLHVFSKIRFLDDNVEGEGIIGKCRDILKFRDAYPCAFIAIGDNKVRMKYADLLHKYNLLIPSIVSPAANISSKARIGEGVAILPQATVGDAEIGDFVIVSSNALVNSDSKVGYACHIECGGIIKKGTTVKAGTKVETGTAI